MDELWPAGAGAGGSRAFVILDAARDDGIYLSLLKADCPWSCLYRGDVAVRLAEVAPYLVELHPDSAYTTWLLDRAWGNSWGIFLTSAASLEALRSHFRRFIMIQLPDGQNVYFRFYDPRVLGIYLPTCLPDEIRAVFGPVDRFLVERGDGVGAVTFRRDGDALIETRIDELIGRYNGRSGCL
jgi:hypothetical protein